MKKFTLPFISRKEFDFMLQCSREFSYKQMLEINSLKSELSRFNRITDTITMLSANDTMSIPKFINKTDETIFVEFIKNYSDRATETITINVHSANNNSCNRVLQLWANISPTYCYIEDIQCYPNKGYGSIAIEELIKYCKKKKTSTVRGHLSSVDLDDKWDIEHHNRLLHFYIKHGFSIVDIKDSVEKNIILTL